MVAGRPRSRVDECRLPDKPVLNRKIETGKPRRRISLDEAVAISRVFNITMEDLLTPVSAAKYKPPSIEERILQIQDLLAKDVGELDATTRANLLRMQSELADRLEEEGEHVYRLQSDAQRGGGVAGARQQGVQRRDGVGTLSVKRRPDGRWRARYRTAPDAQARGPLRDPREGAGVARREDDPARHGYAHRARSRQGDRWRMGGRVDGRPRAPQAEDGRRLQVTARDVASDRPGGQRPAATRQ